MPGLWRLIQSSESQIHINVSHSFWLSGRSGHTDDQNPWNHVDGLMQERCNSLANALELHLSCINPSCGIISSPWVNNDNNFSAYSKLITSGVGAADNTWHSLVFPDMYVQDKMCRKNAQSDRRLELWGGCSSSGLVY